MIQITDNSKCCGCEACVQVCPKHCIDYIQDEEGFFYPIVNTDICINCGLCDKVCPEQTPFDERKPLDVIAAINQDEKVRQESSSGGIFTLLAESVVNEGGVVFGVRFDEQWQAVFDSAETKGALAAFRGSKYVQARVGNSFTQCKKMLDEGRQVLFSGTQCQIAGLNHFLRKQYPNLLTVDFICHGVPSPKVWKEYLHDVTNGDMKVITTIQFRNKKKGWKLFSLHIECNYNGCPQVISNPFPEDCYMRAFLSNLILRPSCYSCLAKGGRSNADITIADFWGINKVNPNMDDDRGTSVVLLNTEKGEKAISIDGIKFAKATYQDVLRYNSAIVTPAIMHPNRNKFFMKLNHNVGLSSLIIQMLRPSLIDRAKNYLKWHFKAIK